MAVMVDVPTDTPVATPIVGLVFEIVAWVPLAVQVEVKVLS